MRVLREDGSVEEVVIEDEPDEQRNPGDLATPTESFLEGDRE